MATTGSFPKVCISILNWNGADKTIQCLKSVMHLDYPNFYPVVVDNASNDDSVMRIQAAFPNVEIIQSESNLGYAGGNELALHRAQANDDTALFWILNNDTTVPKNALSVLVSAYQQHGEALYGGVSLDSQQRLNMTLMQYCPGTRFLYSQHLHDVTYKDYFPTAEPRPVPSLHGGTLMIPLSVIRRQGFMDTNFFMYAEEVDYCLRLGQQGVPSILVPESTITHQVSGSSRGRTGLTGVRWYYQMRNRLHIMRRHGNTLAYVWQLLRFGLITVKYLLLGLFNRDERLDFARYMLLGLRDGLRGQTGKIYAPEDMN